LVFAVDLLVDATEICKLGRRSDPPDEHGLFLA
jgi:hypothetical protein